VKKDLHLEPSGVESRSSLLGLAIEMVSGKEDQTMKTKTIQQVIRGALAGSITAIIVSVAAPANAAHELMYAVDQNGFLFSFFSDSPGTITSAHAITGLQNNESLVGIDYFNGTIYGVGDSSRLYTLDPSSGNATLVGSGPFSPLLNGQTFGVDNGPNGLQVVSSLGQNLTLNRSTAAAIASPALAYGSGDPHFGATPRVDEIAYDNATGIWYAGDTLLNSMATLNPTTGVLSTFGNMGIDASRFNGMDVSVFSGIMYMGTPAASSDPQANLYTVNKTTGAVTLVGLIGNPGDGILVRGLTTAPEPSSVALLGLGAFGLWFARRRQSPA
jgi:hypothetical protein